MKGKAEKQGEFPDHGLMQRSGKNRFYLSLPNLTFPFFLDEVRMLGNN
jgi:hypothetical protein